MISSLQKILRRGWWIVILTTAITIGTVLIYTKMTAEVLYRSSMRVVVSPNVEIGEESDLIRMLDSLSRGVIIPTFTEIYMSKQVLNEALSTIELTTNQDAYKVNAYNLPETNILVLSVTGPDRNKTLQLAKEVSKNAQDLIVKIYPLYTITTLEEPVIPKTPLGQDIQRNIVMAAFLGVGLGLALTLLAYGNLREILGMSK
jgi:capsular polysaccharide biosynthesis protein